MRGTVEDRPLEKTTAFQNSHEFPIDPPGIPRLGQEDDNQHRTIGEYFRENPARIAPVAALLAGTALVAGVAINAQGGSSSTSPEHSSQPAGSTSTNPNHDPAAATKVVRSAKHGGHKMHVKMPAAPGAHKPHNAVSTTPAAHHGYVGKGMVKVNVAKGTALWTLGCEEAHLKGISRQQAEQEIEAANGGSNPLMHGTAINLPPSLAEHDHLAVESANGDVLPSAKPGEILHFKLKPGQYVGEFAEAYRAFNGLSLAGEIAKINDDSGITAAAHREGISVEQKDRQLPVGQGITVEIDGLATHQLTESLGHASGGAAATPVHNPANTSPSASPGPAQAPPAPITSPETPAPAPTAPNTTGGTAPATSPSHEHHRHGRHNSIAIAGQGLAGAGQLARGHNGHHGHHTHNAVPSPTVGAAPAPPSTAGAGRQGAVNAGRLSHKHSRHPRSISATGNGQMQVSSRVGFGTTPEGRLNLQRSFEMAGKATGTPPNEIGAIYAAENGLRGDSTNSADSASGTPQTGNGQWRDPAEPYGHGIGWVTNSYGAGGPFQIIGSTWNAYAEGWSISDRYDLYKAAVVAGRILHAAGAHEGMSDAQVEASAEVYNHSLTYALSVEHTFRYLNQFPAANIDLEAHDLHKSRIRAARKVVGHLVAGVHRNHAAGHHTRRNHKVKYENPFQHASVIGERIDQGVDYRGSGLITSIGPAVVTMSERYDSGWEGGGYLKYQLTGGPMKGRTIFVAEGVQPRVRFMQRLRTGQVIARIIPGSSTGIETGFGIAPSNMDTSYAKVVGGGYYEGQATAAGVDFSNWLKSLGAPGGLMEGRPMVGHFR